MSGSAIAGSSMSCLACLFLVFATCSPWTMYTTYLSYNGVFTSFGVGPFVAGASTSYFGLAPWNYYAGVVWWSDLNTANACQKGTSLYTKWSLPNGLCVNTDPNMLNTTSFVLPSEVQGIQATVILATLFSFFACVSGMQMTKNKNAGGGAACCAFFGMIFSICAFSIWTTWSMSLNLQSVGGDYIPLYATNDQGKTIVITNSPAPVSMYFGWTFVTTIFSFVLLCMSTLAFSAAQKQAMGGGGDGDFGSGGGPTTAMNQI